jgi:hypothetical protein
VLATLVTTIVAAAVGAVASLVVNAVQWRRDDKLKWDPERRIAYERFVTSIDRWEELDHHAAVKAGIEEWFDAPLADRLEPLTGVCASSRLRPHVNAAASEARSRLAELELIGSPTVIKQARALTEAMHNLFNVLRLAATGLRRRVRATPHCGRPLQQRAIRLSRRGSSRARHELTSEGKTATDVLGTPCAARGSIVGWEGKSGNSRGFAFVAMT